LRARPRTRVRFRESNPLRPVFPPDNATANGCPASISSLRRPIIAKFIEE
jgi:hypothetical protein